MSVKRGTAWIEDRKPERSLHDKEKKDTLQNSSLDRSQWDISMDKSRNLSWFELIEQDQNEDNTFNEQTDVDMNVKGEEEEGSEGRTDTTAKEGEFDGVRIKEEVHDDVDDEIRLKKEMDDFENEWVRDLQKGKDSNDSVFIKPESQIKKEKPEFVPSVEIKSEFDGQPQMDIRDIKSEDDEGNRKRTREFDKPYEKSSPRERLDYNPKKKQKSYKVEYETDPAILARRQKQIDYGKNTIGYDNYIKQVQKGQRTIDQPRTPPKHLKYSRRAWDGLVRIWRQRLHLWDPPHADGSASLNDSLSDISVELRSQTSEGSSDERNVKVKKSAQSSSSLDDSFEDYLSLDVDGDV